MRAHRLVAVAYGTAGIIAASFIGPSITIAGSVELELTRSATISHETAGSRVLLDFGQLPESMRGELILTARLRLPVPGLEFEGRSVPFSLHQVTTPWAGLNPTWTSPWRTSGGDFLAASTGVDVAWKGARRSSLNFDVTEMVRDIADGEAEDCGFLLTVPEHRGDGFLAEELTALGSLEGATLRITYSPIKHLGFNGSRSIVDRAQRLRAMAALEVREPGN